jgi:uncharacterized protein
MALMQVQKNIIISGAAGKPITLDVFCLPGTGPKSAVIYAHGFNGFKDWGNFDIIASQFANAGFVFIKFNFSHNGTAPSNTTEFVDLESYAENDYSKELEDLEKVIEYTLSNNNPNINQVNKNELYLIGHSMGGGIVILKAAEDSRIKKIATWASINECKTPWGSWSDEKIKEWERTGIAHVANSRTKQNMPLRFQLYLDYQQNKERLDIKKAIGSLKIPVLLCHGTRDEAVPFEKAERLKSWQPSAELFAVESDHVFGRKHPWESENLPEPMQRVVDKTIEFFKR